MSTRRKPRSLLRRLVYFVVMLVTGGGAGDRRLGLQGPSPCAGPLQHGAGQDPGRERRGRRSSERRAGVGRLGRAQTGQSPASRASTRSRSRRSSSTRGSSRQGRTVDIQARVRKVDVRDEKTHDLGEQALRREPRRRRQGRSRPPLASTARSRSTGRPATRSIVEVWDRKGGLDRAQGVQDGLSRARRLPAGLGDPRPGGHRAAGESSTDSDRNRIVFQSERVRDLPIRGVLAAQREVAERPIVIK